MTRTPILLLVTTALIFPAALSAEQVYQLDEVVLSGGLTALAADGYAKSYTILTAEDIEARGVKTVQDALRDVPGVAVGSTSSSEAKVRIRGSEYGHVLVLIDGVEANSSGNGDYIFRGMDVTDIERIEVLRGPQSTIYGSGAAAGVISITTKGASQPGLSYGGGVEFGGLKTRAANAYVHHQGERASLSLSLSTRHVGGDDDSRSGGDKDFNNIDTIGLKGEVDLTETAKAGFTLRHSWQEYGYDGNEFGENFGPDDYVVDEAFTAKGKELYGSLWVEGVALGGRLKNRVVFSGTKQKTDHFELEVQTWQDTSIRRGLSYVGSYSLDGAAAESADQKLNFSADASREIYRALFIPNEEHNHNTYSLALEYIGKYTNGIDIQAGVRREFQDRFDDTNAWNISAGWHVPEQYLRLRAAVGRASISPSMFQQYGYIPGQFEGNPALKPESSLNYELGADLDYSGGRGSLGLTIFHSKIKDMIIGSGDTSVNLPGTSTRKGAEVSTQIQALENLLIGADYTYTDARQEDGTAIVRAPRHQLGLRATVGFAGGKGAVTGNLRYVADSYDAERFNTNFQDKPATTKLPNYATFDLAAHYDLTDQVRLSGRVVNLFDKEYSQAWGYYGQGRTAYVGLQAKF